MSLIEDGDEGRIMGSLPISRDFSSSEDSVGDFSEEVAHARF